MSLINAQGRIFREWEGLLSACEVHGSLLPNVQPLMEALAGILDQARGVKKKQEEYEGRRQAATQQLTELIDNGQEAARRLRGFVKAQLGTKNELLVQFGAAPIRRPVRSARKPGEPGTPPPPDPEAK